MIWACMPHTPAGPAPVYPHHGSQAVPPPLPPPPQAVLASPALDGSLSGHMLHNKMLPEDPLGVRREGGGGGVAGGLGAWECSGH